MPRLSLCLIARDEEMMLPECLASVKGIVDEIIVVDTGSADQTRAIAQAAGARIVDHPWHDDFAAARNAALPVATGDWILVLDADERLGPGAGAALRKAMRSPQIDCFLLPLTNASRLDATFAEVLAGKATRGEAVWLPRLVRRVPDLSWEGVVHESIGTWLTRGKRQTGRVEAPIIHYGTVPELRAALKKDARNLRLLERRCELEPNSPVARSYLARELIRVGDLPRADRELERGWPDLHASRAAGENPAYVQLVSTRAHRLLERGQCDEAITMLTEVMTWAPVNHPNLPLLTGTAWAKRELADGEGWAEAERWFRAALATKKTGWPEEPLPGATGWQSSLRLAVTLLAQGRPAEALPLLTTVLAERPDDLDAQLALAEAHVSANPRRALALAEPLLSRPVADAWLIAADACEALGLDAERRAFLDRALALPLQSLHRRPRLVAARTLGPLWATLAGYAPQTPAPMPVAELIAAGTRAAEAGDAAAALGAWLAALRLAPRAPLAWTAIATALHALGHPDEALAALAGARLLSPRDPELLALSAELLLLTGHTGEACRFARRLQGIDPTHPLPALVLQEAGVHGAGGPTQPHPAVVPGAPPLLSVIIPTYDRPEALRNLLDRLALQDLPPAAFEVIVVDDGSPTPTADTGPRPYAFSLVRQDNAGPAAARNRAIAQARGKWLVIYNDDTLPDPDGLRRHLDAQRSCEVPEAILGRFDFLPEHLDDPLTALMQQTTLLFGYTRLEAGRRYGWETFWTCNLSVPTEVVRSVGGFDPAFRHALCEDVELGRRLEAVGVQVRYEPAIGAGHDHRLNLEGYLRRAETLGAETLRIHRKHGQAVLKGHADGGPEVRLKLRSRVEATAPARDVLALSTAAALARGLPPGAPDRERVTQAIRGLLVQHFDRGLLSAYEGWASPLQIRPRTPRTMTSIVIPNLNGFPHVEGCLATLRSTTTAPTELILVDNGSTDGSLEWLRKQPDVRVLEMGRNLGAPAARNRGLAVASGERILFCDNDVLFTPRWHEILVGHLDAWPDIGMVGPVSDYVVDMQKAARPPREGESLDAYAAAVHLENQGKYSYTTQLILFFILAQREVIEQIGGIDEGFGRWGFEDNDWSLRATIAGYHLRVARDCFIRHLGSQTAVSAKIDYNRLLIENWGVFKRKWDIDPALPYGERFDLNAIVARGFDASRHFVPFR